MTEDPGERLERERTETWRRMLTGEDPTLARLRRWWQPIPASPRCKVCAAPFHGLGRILTRLIMHGASVNNPLLCNACFGSLRKAPGGAEIEISVLFADIRGSTGIAERTSAASFSRLVQRFYGHASTAIDRHGGVVDKFLGDGVMALFVPVITGEAHAARAVAAGRAVLAASEASDLVTGGVRVGVGIHTGVAFVGAIGSGDRLDFTALGDSVNVAARLGALAGPGELMASEAAWSAAGATDPGAERRTIEVSGRSEPLSVVVVARPAAAVPA